MLRPASGCHMPSIWMVEMVLKRGPTAEALAIEAPRHGLAGWPGEVMTGNAISRLRRRVPIIRRHWIEKHSDGTRASSQRAMPTGTAILARPSDGPAGRNRRGLVRGCAIDPRSCGIRDSGSGSSVAPDPEALQYRSCFAEHEPEDPQTGDFKEAWKSVQRSYCNLLRLIEEKLRGRDRPLRSSIKRAGVGYRAHRVRFPRRRSIGGTMSGSQSFAAIRSVGFCRLLRCGY
jgi:hypothetical protein